MPMRSVIETIMIHDSNGLFRSFVPQRKFGRRRTELNSNPNALRLFVFGAYNFILIITGNIYR